MKSKRPKPAPADSHDPSDVTAAAPRIIGGRFRHRKLMFSSQQHVRPMKDRVREALFNLIGPAVVGKHAIDLFAGTGALGFEALSRGAASATFVERHFPTADMIKQNAETLEIANIVTVLPANVLLWSRRMPELPRMAWLVFVSPPWDMFVENTEELMLLLNSLVDHAPPGSHFVVEADERFDLAQLPQPDHWQVREYPPAIVAILRLPEPGSEQNVASGEQLQ